MTADEIDTRIAFVKLFDQTRDLMARSADQTRRSFDHRAAAARLTAEAPTQPARLALPAPARATMAPEPVAKVFDLSGIAPFTERALSEITGISLATIAKAVQRKSIRTIRRKGRPRLLDVAGTARWLQHAHSISPEVLRDINEEEEN